MRISLLPNAGLPLSGNELVPMTQEGHTVKTTIANILAGVSVTPSSELPSEQPLYSTLSVGDSGGAVLNFDNRFFAENGSFSIDYFSRVLYDTASNPAFNWHQRTIHANNGTVCFDWNTTGKVKIGDPYSSQNGTFITINDNAERIILNGVELRMSGQIHVGVAGQYDYGLPTVSGEPGQVLSINLPRTIDGQDMSWTSALASQDGTASIDWNSRLLEDENGNHSVLWNTGELRSGGTTTLEWKGQQLKDSSGTLAANWTGRILYDENQSQVLDWNGRVLFGSEGEQCVDWYHYYLNDDNQHLSINWLNRILVNTTGSYTIDWQNMTMWDGAHGFPVMNWGLSLLRDTNDTTTFDWQNRWLYNDAGVIVVELNNGRLYAANSSVSIDWYTHSLSDGVAPVPSLDWGNRLLIEGTTASLDWAARALRYGGYAGLTWGNGTENTQTIIGDAWGVGNNTRLVVDDYAQRVTLTTRNITIGSEQYVFPTGIDTGVLTSDNSGNLSWTTAPGTLLTSNVLVDQTDTQYGIVQYSTPAGATVNIVEGWIDVAELNGATLQVLVNFTDRNQNTRNITVYDSATAGAGYHTFTTNVLCVETNPLNTQTLVFGGTPLYDIGMSIKSGGYGWAPAPTVPTVTTDDLQHTGGQPTATFTGTIVSDGGSTIIEHGVVFGTSPNPTLADNHEAQSAPETAGQYIMNSSYMPTLFQLTYVRAYATNAIGTGYGTDLTFTPDLCLAKGTKVTLADRTTKNIEDVEHDDLLLVWNFDEGRFDTSSPLWIKAPHTTGRYNLLTFSDGSELKTISQHRIFNKEKGMFTYPMTDDTPIGTTTSNVDGQEVVLTGKEYVYEDVEYYNVITGRHINLFANGILTSCSYNNVYPIAGMKFVKDDRVLRPREEFENISDEYFEGLRLSEQTMPLSSIEKYVEKLVATACEPAMV